MPVCKKCRWLGPTVEFRRSPKEGYLCKEKAACKRRVRQIKEAASGNRD